MTHNFFYIFAYKFSTRQMIKRVPKKKEEIIQEIPLTSVQVPEMPSTNVSCQEMPSYKRFCSKNAIAVRVPFILRR